MRTYVSSSGTPAPAECSSPPPMVLRFLVRETVVLPGSTAKQVSTYVAFGCPLTGEVLRLEVNSDDAGALEAYLEARAQHYATVAETPDGRELAAEAAVAWIEAGLGPGAIESLFGGDTGTGQGPNEREELPEVRNAASADFANGIAGQLSDSGGAGRVNIF